MTTAGAGALVDPTKTDRPAVPAAVRTASEWAVRLLVIAAGVYVLARVLSHFAEIVIPLLVALLLAALLHPVVDRLSRRLPRGAAALLVLLGTLLLVAALFALVGQQTASGFAGLRDQASAGLTDVQRWAATGPLHIPQSATQGLLGRAEHSASTNRSAVLSGALGAALTATHLIEGLFITLFASFFFLSSGQGIWAWLLRMLPTAAQRPLDDAARSGWVTLTHYIRATLVVAVVDGLGVGVGAALLGVPLALPLGVVVFLGALVPVVGALVTGVLAVLVALVAHGPLTALAMLGVVVLVNQIEAHGLQPFLLGRAVAVHPLAVILTIAAGATLAGVPGALFAVPLAAVANTMVTSLTNRGRPGADPAEPLTADDAPLAPARPEETDLADVPVTQHGDLAGLPVGR